MRIRHKVALAAIAALLALAVAQPANAATFYYLVRVSLDGKVVATLGVYDSLTSCLNALQQQPSKANLQCRQDAIPSSSSNDSEDGWWLIGQRYDDPGLILYVFGGPYTISRCLALRAYMNLGLMTRGFSTSCIPHVQLKVMMGAGWTLRW